MTPLGRTALIAAALLVCLYILALAVPALMDWDRFRPELEAKASDLLGRKVILAGPITVRLLPSPTAVLEDVSIGEPALLSVDEVRIGLKALPLLSGQVEIRDLRLRGGQMGILRDLHAGFIQEGGLKVVGGARLPFGPVTFEAVSEPPGTGGATAVRAMVRLPTADSTLSFEGGWTSAQSLSGRILLAVPSLRHAAGIESLPDLPLSAESTVSLSAVHSELPDLAVTLAGSVIRGAIVMDAGQPTPVIAAKLKGDRLDLDTLWPLAQPQTAEQTPASSSGASAITTSNTPPAAQAQPRPLNLDAMLTLGVDSLIWRGKTISNAKVKARLDKDRVELEEASALLPGATTLTVAGNGSLTEGKFTFDGSLGLATKDLPALRSWLNPGIEGGPQRGSLKSNLSLTGRQLTLSHLALTWDDAKAQGEAVLGLESIPTLAIRLTNQGVEGGFEGKLEQGGPAGVLSLRAASFAQAVRLVSPSYRARSGGMLVASATIASQGEVIAVQSLEAKIGDVDLTGRGKLVLSGRPQMVAELTSSAIMLDHFLPPEAKTPAPAAAESGGGGAPTATAAHHKADERSRVPMDLSVLTAFDADLTLAAKSITVAGRTLEGMAAHLSIENGTMSLDRLTGRLMGGDVGLAARLNAAGMAGSLTVAGADLAGLGLATAGLKLSKGRLDAQTRLSATGRSPDDLIRSLAGDGKWVVRDGLVEGFDLAAVNAQMQHLDNIGNLLGLVQAGLAGGSSHLSSLTGSMKADKGVISSTDIKLVAEGGGADATAVLDLPKDTIESRITFKLATSGAPPLTLRLDGPMGAPRKTIDVNPLQRYLVAKGLGKNLKGKGGGLIETLMNGGLRLKKKDSP
ncbi:conserved hypothetical protein [Candidatus Terasakiella magnetica]|nr:conserved hypothetical protein [Candidatus Terasakiella magnetica]